MRIDRLPSRVLGSAASAAVVVLLLLPATALGHAELESSSPGVGATVTAPLDRVVLTFTEDLTSKSFFRVELGDDQVARGSVDAANPDRMIAQTASLGPGTYTVKWVAYAADLHQEKGDFRFTIEAATPPPATPSPSPTASGAPTPSPGGSPSASPAPTLTPVPVPSPSAAPTPPQTTGGDIVVPIVATLGLIGGLGVWLLRRQRRV